MRTAAGLALRWQDRRRDRAWRAIRRSGMAPPSPEAFAAFGRSIIVPPARIANPHLITIGDGVVIHEEVWLSVVPSHDDITPHLVIEDGTRIGRFCQLSCVGSIHVERDVVISDHVHIGDTFHEYADPTTPVAAQGMSRPRPVRIGEGALIGMGAIVLTGVSIGPRAYVSEGAVVTTDVPAGAVVAGNPGRLVRSPQR